MEGRKGRNFSKKTIFLLKDRNALFPYRSSVVLSEIATEWETYLDSFPDNLKQTCILSQLDGHSQADYVAWILVLYFWKLFSSWKQKYPDERKHFKQT